MNLKRIFGPLLIILGIVGLIYGAILFMNDDGGEWKTILVMCILGIVFFISGLGLIQGTQDKS
ncbi:hypothetical protein P872_16135 [Rhodonellum psychrophilum GCM71 = DSM 17998]|uniref:Phosphatidate cytidylyltransferase n=2 Tax=Rhodonellum TaxID=336827 RepID=U5C5B8_9BACT|nr:MULTISPECIES: hypothetical protein [Rhodonellum]ERM83372.1 hypothetical protein P872_16135 [Rhodonellum psychrophilum GCM71 = DSM 17998]MDO9551172.1 hypothetical protein [Rhodonellum sp.]SDZ38248.1 hypothetical protein SAMN05444412_11229 [Rhodonellum ikkaensis]